MGITWGMMLSFSGDFQAPVIEQSGAWAVSKRAALENDDDARDIRTATAVSRRETYPRTEVMTSKSRGKKPRELIGRQKERGSRWRQCFDGSVIHEGEIRLFCAVRSQVQVTADLMFHCLECGWKGAGSPSDVWIGGWTEARRAALAWRDGPIRVCRQRKLSSKVRSPNLAGQHHQVLRAGNFIRKQLY